MNKKHLLIGAALTGALIISGCQSNGSAGHVPSQSTSRARRWIAIRLALLSIQNTLKFKWMSRDTQLRVPEIMKVREFLDSYTDVGHGPLVISMPHDGR